MPSVLPTFFASFANQNVRFKFMLDGSTIKEVSFEVKNHIASLKQNLNLGFASISKKLLIICSHSRFLYVIDINHCFEHLS